MKRQSRLLLFLLTSRYVHTFWLLNNLHLPRIPSKKVWLQKKQRLLLKRIWTLCHYICQSLIIVTTDYSNIVFMTFAFFQSQDTEVDPEMTSRQKREANLGVVLISISILFIVCQSVKIVPDVYEVAWCRLGSSNVTQCPTTKLIDILIELSHLLLAINSSANFVIYTWRGKIYW